MTPGRSPKGDSPVTSTSNAGSRSSSSARVSRSAVVRRALRAGETVPTWLARSRRRCAWNAAPSGEPHLGVAVPTEVQHGALGREQVERALQPRRRRARMHDEVAPADGIFWPREAGAECGRDLGPGAVDVDERDLDRGEPRQQASDAAPDHPSADDGDAVSQQRRCIPQGVDGGLDRAGEHGARGRHGVGHDGHRAGGHHVRRLVRVQAEDRAAPQLRRSLLDHTDVEVAVLHGPREVALLKRRAHRGVLARRHAAAEHQRLGAATHAGAQRPDDDIAVPWHGQRDRPDLSAPGRAQPERMGVIEHVL